MYSSKPGLLIGFHGCEQSVRDDIVSGKANMKPSTNSHDWLGEGFYFWENNYERALDFARNPPGKKSYKNPAVLGAIIDLQYCLDYWTRSSWLWLRTLTPVLNPLPIQWALSFLSIYLAGIKRSY